MSDEDKQQAADQEDLAWPRPWVIFAAVVRLPFIDFGLRRIVPDEALSGFRDLTTAVSIISVLPLLVARMAAELRQACGTMRLLEQVIEQAQDTILVLMADGRCAHVNDAFCRTTGWWREELVRLRLRDLIPGDGISTGDFQTLIRSGGSWQGTLTRTRKDGTRFRTTAALTALDDARGKTTHIISVERDIFGRPGCRFRRLGKQGRVI